MLRKLLDLVFWLVIAIYFGGTLALGAVVAPVIFKTTAAKNIALPGTPPPLDATSQAGGEIFGEILARFAIVEGICLALLLLIILGWFYCARAQRASTAVIALVWLLIAGLTAFDSLILTPRVFQVRQQVRDTAPQHAATAPAPWPERTQFDALHKESEFLGHIKAYALLGIIGIAALRGIKPNPAPEPLPNQNKLP